MRQGEELRGRALRQATWVGWGRERERKEM